MIHHSTYQPRCCACGRFCIIADSGTYWGDSTMLEPPDELYFCKECVKDEVDQILEHGYIDCWWLRPTFTRVAKSIMRHRRKQGQSASPH